MELKQRLRIWSKSMRTLYSGYTWTEWENGQNDGVGTALTSIDRMVGLYEDNDAFDLVRKDAKYDLLEYDLQWNGYVGLQHRAKSNDHGGWDVYFENLGGEEFQIGFIQVVCDFLPFDTNRTIGFAWSDSLDQAGFESTFEEAVRMLAIINHRKRNKK